MTVNKLVGRVGGDAAQKVEDFVAIGERRGTGSGVEE